MKLYRDRDEKGKEMYDNLQQDASEIMDNWRQRYRAIKKAKEDNAKNISIDPNIKFDIVDLKRDIQFYSIITHLVHDRAVIHYAITDIEDISDMEADELDVSNRVSIAAWEMLYYIRKELE